MQISFQAFFQAFLLTLLFEFPVWWLFLRGQASNVRIFLACALVNSITLPFVWFVFPLLIQSYILSLMLSEAFIFLLEVLLISLVFSVKPKDALLISLCANAFSFLAGLGVAFLL